MPISDPPPYTQPITSVIGLPVHSCAACGAQWTTSHTCPNVSRSTSVPTFGVGEAMRIEAERRFARLTATAALALLLSCIERELAYEVTQSPLTDAAIMHAKDVLSRCDIDGTRDDG